MTSNNTTLNELDSEHKCWIHKVDEDIKDLIEKKQSSGFKIL